MGGGGWASFSSSAFDVMVALTRFSSGWMAWRWSVFGSGEYRVYMDKGLPSNISLIPRTSVSSSPDLWISADG